MEQTSSAWKIAVAVLAVIAAAFTAYNVGWSNAQAEYEAMADLNVLLNRSDMETIELIDGPVYVFGHQSPDADTVCSAIAYAELLRDLGYDAQPAVLGPVKNETKYILEQAEVEEPQVLEDVSGMNVVLVDRGEYAQSAEGLKDAHIVSIINHHGEGNITTSNQLVYDARPLGSTATIILIRYYNYGFEPTPQTAKLMLGALLSDTSNLQSNTTTEADKTAAPILAKLAGIEDTDAFYRDMFQAAISYEGMTDEEIFLNDIKEYEAAGKKFAIACVDAWDEDAAEGLATRMKATMNKVEPSLGVDMVFVQVSIFHDDLSKSYLLASNDAAADVLKEAFGEKLEFDGTSYILEPGVSRKQVLVPAISDVLAAFPQE